jgi:hypothetical protein
MEVLPTHIEHIGTRSFRETVLFHTGIVTHTKEREEREFPLVT